MIKIELSTEVRNEIEKIFLDDLFGSDPNGQKKGKLVNALGQIRNRRILQKNRNINLYDYLYDGNGTVKTDAVKELLLADKIKMDELIDKFGSYNCKSESDELLNNIFRYDRFSERVVVRNILSKMGITVCPYCNRSYIVTLKKCKVRPQLDHYYPKAKYPYLALSLYNLIPSCGSCNQAKLDMDTRVKAILYPYKEEFGEKIVFATDIKDENQFVKCMTGESDKWEVSIQNPEGILGDKVGNQNDVLHLTELYNEHKDYIADIFKSFHVNTGKRIKELLTQFPEIFSTEEEVLGLMFMSDIRKESWGKRPLTKLTHDIYMEIGQWKNAKIR